MSLSEKLKLLYGEATAREVLPKFEALFSDYQNRIQPKQGNINEKDTILITYGDQIQDIGDTSLSVLHTFYNQFLKDVIQTIHILPFYPYTSDDGFSVVDYLQVDPNLGTWEDIQNLSSSCQLMFDAVINHISKSSSWFKGYLEGDAKYLDFFIDVDPETDLSQVTRPRALPLLTHFQAKSGSKHIWTTFSEDQVDINIANPEVLYRVLEVLLNYIEKGADFIRLDAIAFLWKEIGTSCIHHPKTHLIVKLIREIFDEIQSGTKIITETNVPHDENISYFGNGSDEAHLVYNFSLPPLLAHGILRGNAKWLTEWANQLNIPDECCFFNFTASHDGVGVRPVTGILPNEEIEFLAQTSKVHGGQVSVKDNGDGTQSPYELNCTYMDLLSHPDSPVDEKIKKFILSQALMLAMPGVPGIYFHSLIGSSNDLEGVQKTGRARSINREKLELNPLLNDLNNCNSTRFKVFNNYLHILNCRTNEALFDPFLQATYPDLHNSVFTIERKTQDKGSLLCLFNLSKDTLQLNLPKAYANSTEVLDESIVNAETITLAPWDFKWLKSSAQ